MSWEGVWTLVFFGAFGTFVIISLLVAVFGLIEIRATFAAWRARRAGGGA